MHLGLLSLVVVGISCAPHNINNKSANFPLIHEDADAASLVALKPRSKKWHLEPLSMKRQDVTEVKESHSIFSGVNGKSQSIKEENQQVSKNGKPVSRIFHQENPNREAGQKPHVEELTEVDIPELNFHENIVNNDGEETAFQVKRNGEDSFQFPRSAAELAGYVLETGDQAGVVQLLEMMLTEGKISEEEALAYVENIKRYLDEAEKASQQPNNEEEKIREILLERHLEEKAIKQKMEEEEAAKEMFMKNMITAEHKENDENESILKINKFLEETLKERKISKSLYNHLKEALIESVVEGLEKDTNNIDSLDYGQY